MIRNSIEDYINTEKNIKTIKNNINKYKQLLQIINFNYYTDISFDYNFYNNIKFKIPNSIINNAFLNNIHILNKLSRNILDLQLSYRQNIIKLNSLKNYIITNVDNIDNKYKSNRNFNKPTHRLNRPELTLFLILQKLQIKYTDIILIIPQYTLPIKYKKYLYADFFILLLHQEQLFPIIIEFDGTQHLNKHFYFSKDRVYSDIIKNNFAYANFISMIRCYDVNTFNYIFLECITHIKTSLTPYYNIPHYNTYLQLL